MGNAIAVEAASRGALVTLVTSAPAPAIPGIDVVQVETAAEMAEATWSRASGADVAVLAAAVADFRPSRTESDKLRRDDGIPLIDLEATPDVLAGISGMDERPFLVGFAAESGSLEGALRKATSKGVDLLVGNDVAKTGSGFGTDTNEVTVYTPDGSAETWPLLSKREVAQRLWDRISETRSRG
jgi:phosphopantothenoylcysteine decarboxylase/phosphopantothenate--cysteine ligase